jgi:hypothetical protein
MVRGFRLFFFSNEGDPREPIHVHVLREGRRAKFWLEPEVRPASGYDLRRDELREAEELVSAYEAEIRRRWHEHFGP